MDDLQKLNKIEHLMKYFSEGDRNRALNKMVGKITDKMFKDLCKEYEMCNVCGSKLDRSGTFAVQECYPNSHTIKEVKAIACPVNDCQYNKDKKERLQNHENHRGALYG